MALTKAQICELQEHFDKRGKLHDIVITIKCNLIDPSFFYAYKDNFGNKKYLNIPVEPDDIMAILTRKIDNIEKDIIELTTEGVDIIIMNEENLKSSIGDYRSRYPDTYTSLATIRETLRDSLMGRLEEGQGDSADDYHIEVCSDWQDKIYAFELLNVTEEYAQFQYKGIFKL